MARKRRNGKKIILRPIIDDRLGDEVEFNSLTKCDEWLQRPSGTLGTVLHKRHKKIVRNSKNEPFAIMFALGEEQLSEEDVYRMLHRKDDRYISDILAPNRMTKEHRAERARKSALVAAALDKLGETITKKW